MGQIKAIITDFDGTLVDTIIANCYVEKPNNYKYVNHIDSNKINNHPSNLEWCTN